MNLVPGAVEEAQADAEELLKGPLAVEEHRVEVVLVEAAGRGFRVYIQRVFGPSSFAAHAEEGEQEADQLAGGHHQRTVVLAVPVAGVLNDEAHKVVRVRLGVVVEAVKDQRPRRVVEGLPGVDGVGEAEALVVL